MLIVDERSKGKWPNRSKLIVDKPIARIITADDCAELKRNSECTTHLKTRPASMSVRTEQESEATVWSGKAETEQLRYIQFALHLSAVMRMSLWTFWFPLGCLVCILSKLFDSSLSFTI